MKEISKLTIDKIISEATYEDKAKFCVKLGFCPVCGVSLEEILKGKEDDLLFRICPNSFNHYNKYLGLVEDLTE